MVSEGLIINPVTKQSNENLSICLLVFLTRCPFLFLIRTKQKSRNNCHAKSFSHVHIERHFLYHWPQTNVLTHENVGCSKGLELREKPERESSHKYYSVVFNDILYIQSHNPPFRHCPMQPLAVSQLPLHNSFSLTFMGNVSDGKPSLDGFTATRLWIQHWF